MATIALELKTACPRCGENVPLNGVVPSVSCPKCHEAVPLDTTAWKRILEAPALDGPRAEPGKPHASIVEGVRPIMRSFARKDAACTRCAVVLPLASSLAQAARGWCVCVQCGDRVSVRPAPAELAGLGGMTHVIGEDFAQLAPQAPVATQAFSIACTACGGALPVDQTTSRTVRCTYCNAGVMLSDAVWERLHPVPKQRAFYLHVDPAIAPRAAGKAFDWDSLDDVAFGRDGHLYFIGKNDNNTVVWSCDARTFATRWRRDQIPLRANDRKPQITITPDGHVLAWQFGKHAVTKLSCSDGATVATLGGQEPPDAKAHGLDLERCYAFAADVDGTMLGLLHGRVLRWSADGTPIETWPVKHGFFGDKHQKLGPLWRTSPDGERHKIEPEDTPSVGNVKSRPLEMSTSYVAMTIAWDGSIYMHGSNHLLKLAHDGTKQWCTEIKPSNNDWSRPGVDANGNVYLLRGLAKWAHGIYRVSPDGTDLSLLVDGRKPATPLCEEHHMAVAPDGTIFVVDFGGNVRVFGPDGALRFASEKARERDAYRAKRVAEEGW